MSEQNKEIVKRFYDEVVNQGRLAVVEELLAPDYVEHGNPAGSGIEGFRRFVAGLSEAFPDLRISVEDLIAEGDRVVARVAVRATHAGTFMGVIPPTGAQVSFSGIDIFQLGGGRIVGRWNQRDLLGLIRQLGVDLPTAPRAAPRDGMVATVHSQDETPIGYRRSGQGPPLVLVHGAVADHRRWLPLLPELERRFTVYAVDRRGRGASGDAAEYALEREFEDVAAVIDAVGEPAHLLAHSFGAFCALEAARLTANISSLVLYEPPPPGVRGTLSPEVESKLQRLLEAGDDEGLVSTFLREVAQVSSGDLDLMRSRPAWPSRVATARTILREVRALERLPPLEAERYRSIRVPTLLLLGGDSPRLYAQTVEQLAAALPDVRVAVLPGQRHVAMDTAPELFLREVLEFLER